MPSPTYHSPPEQHALHEYQPHHDISYPQPYTRHSLIPNQLYGEGQGLVSPQSYADGHGAPAAPTTDAMSTAYVQPNEPKPALEPHVSQTPSYQSSSGAFGKAHLLSERNDFYLDWVIKILGVAAAVTFGIWAPISYKITADGNAGNDEAQASLMSQIGSLRAEAATAASAQRSAVTALAQLQDQINNIGLLRAWEFCDGQTLAVCKSLRSSSTNVVFALSSLGGLIHESGTTATSANITPTDGASGGGSTGGTRLGGTALVAVILGSVFGGIVLIGLVVGMLAKRRKVRRIRQGAVP